MIRKINNLKLKNCQLKLSLQIKSEAKAIKVSALNCLAVENLMYYFNACCIIHILSYTQNIWALGFRALLKKIGESAIHRIFVTWVVFIEAIFSCLNLKPDDGFLPCSMPEAFNKTGHGLTDIILPKLYLNQCSRHLLSTRMDLKALHHRGGLFQKF